MTTPTTTPSVEMPRRVSPPRNFETIAWMWMRYSALLLIPLAFGHMLLQDVFVGVHNMDVNYVAMRWGFVAWRVYDAALLIFAFAHGMNGLRQILMDYIKSEAAFRVICWVLLLIWLVVSIIGAIAIIGGVRAG